MLSLGVRARELERSISSAIDFLYHNQLDYGEFKTYAWRDDQGDNSVFDSSPFVTALVLYSIGFRHDEKIRTMTGKALDFLCAEMEGPGLWRYWSSRNERHEFLPPDLDVTCCASFVLNKYNRPFPANRDLILGNRNSKGLFYTWMTPRADSQPDFVREIQPLVNPIAAALLPLGGVLEDVDPAVNANALLYLGESVHTRATISYLMEVVLKEKEQTRGVYYLDPVSNYYMLSRAYWNGVLSLVETSDRVTDRIAATQRNDGSWGNELLTALAACTLLNFGKQIPALDRAVDYLLSAQRDGGSWPTIPMYRGAGRSYGSEELTTAFCVEALERYS